jgi:hypothetical protein
MATDFELAYYSQPKINIELFKNTEGDYDFKSDTPSVSKQSYKLKAVELFQQVSKDYIRKVADSKYEKSFLIKFLEEIKPGWFIIDLKYNKKYNVRESTRISEDIFIVTCYAVNNESLK